MYYDKLIAEVYSKGNLCQNGANRYRRNCVYIVWTTTRVKKYHYKNYDKFKFHIKHL